MRFRSQFPLRFAQTRLPAWLMLGAGIASAAAPPDPAQPGAPVPALAYRSLLAPFRAQADAEPIGCGFQLKLGVIGCAG